MKWPFRSKRDETDIRIFRDPKTGELTLRLQGDIGWPTGPDKEPVVTLNVSLRMQIADTAARQLRNQINALLPQDSE
jgi:hypothetical protein